MEFDNPGKKLELGEMGDDQAAGDELDHLEAVDHLMRAEGLDEEAAWNEVIERGTEQVLQS